MKDVHWGHIGDFVGFATLGSILYYFFLVQRHVSGVETLTLFGNNWSIDGFCISFKDTWYNSHLLCFYVDSLLALILGFLASKHKHSTVNHPGVKVLNANKFSVFGHGFAHATLWYYSPLQDGYVVDSYSSLHCVILVTIITLFFHGFFVNIDGMSMGASWLQSMIHAIILITYIEKLFIFTYVNTVLFVNIAGFAIISSEKNYFTAMKAMIVGLPVAIVTWIEPVLCDSFLINWGGHLLFDVTIPLSAVAYYFLVIGQEYPSKMKQA